MKISFFAALQLTFIILKLCNVIGWSWWWVFAPLWLPLVLVLLFLVLKFIADNGSR